MSAAHGGMIELIPFKVRELFFTKLKLFFESFVNLNFKKPQKYGSLDKFFSREFTLSFVKSFKFKDKIRG